MKTTINLIAFLMIVMTSLLIYMAVQLTPSQPSQPKVLTEQEKLEQMLEQQRKDIGEITLDTVTVQKYYSSIHMTKADSMIYNGFMKSHR